MKAVVLTVIVILILLFIWGSLSFIFGKVGSILVRKKDKVKNDIENNEEDWF